MPPSIAMVYGQAEVDSKHWLDTLVKNEPPRVRTTRRKGIPVASGSSAQCAVTCVYTQEQDQRCQESPVTHLGA